MALSKFVLASDYCQAYLYLIYRKINILILHLVKAWAPDRCRSELIRNTTDIAHYECAGRGDSSRA